MCLTLTRNTPLHQRLVLAYFLWNSLNHATPTRDGVKSPLIPPTEPLPPN